MAPELSENLLGTDIDGADRAREDRADEDEAFVQFVFVTVGEHRFALPVDVVRTVTDPPTAVTRVPRTPPSIEGLMDLRGEITAVVDPRVHFPTPEIETDREQLIVFDRPNDQQSAAIRVDDVIGVEVVPESNVIDQDNVDDSPLSGDALAHPLVAALVMQEHEQSQPDEPTNTTASDRTDDGAGVFESSIDDASPLSSAGSESGELGGSIGETFEIESDDADDELDGAGDEPREIVVEATALIDVERMLLASGQQ